MNINSAIESTANVAIKIQFSRDDSRHIATHDCLSRDNPRHIATSKVTIGNSSKRFAFPRRESFAPLKDEVNV
jgi:hypothetical protein